MTEFDYGPGVPMYERDRLEAMDAFHLQKQPYQFATIQGNVCLVDCAADTGSRYLVLVTPLPDEAKDRFGCECVISVLQPWQNTAMWESLAFPPHEDWVREKLGSPARKERGAPLHGGDLVALTLSIAAAMGVTEKAGVLRG